MAGGFGNGALQLTHHADAGRIARELAQLVEETTRVNKSGKVSTRRKLNFGIGDKSTMAARVVNARRKRDGQPPLWGRQLTDAARKLTQARIRSVNFVRSGWLASIKALAPLLKKSPRAKPGAVLGVKPQERGLSALRHCDPSERL